MERGGELHAFVCIAEPAKILSLSSSLSAATPLLQSLHFFTVRRFHNCLFLFPNMKQHSVVSQEPYVRSRESPYFRGDSIKDRAPALAPVFPGTSDSSNILRPTSGIITNPEQKKLELDILEQSMESPLMEDSASDIILEPFTPPSTKSFSKISKSTSFPFTSNQSESSIDFGDLKNSVKASSPTISETTEKYSFSPELMTPTSVKSYNMNRTKPNLSKIPLPQSAASFYNGFSPRMEIVESCEGIKRLNAYLKARKKDVRDGVPGKFLRAVIAQDVSDVGAVAATLTYALYLSLFGENDIFCTVPVINMKRLDLNSQAEIKWILDSCQIRESSLIFIDEIDLSYYDLFGSLKVVLINGHKLPTKQEALKEAVVEIFNCRKGETVYSWVETVTVEQDCSCCTLIAEMFAMTSPEILAGKAFSRLLLAGILLETANLTNALCTSKDQYIATLLLNGAGRFGCSGLYQILRYLMHDVSGLKVSDILRKDFKTLSRIGKSDGVASKSMVLHIGMCSIGISVEQLLSHDDASTQEIKYFRQLEKVRLLMIVSGYYDKQKNFKREILVSAGSVELMRNLLTFFNSNASQLPLKVLQIPGLREEMRAFEMDKVTSRKTLKRLLEEFGGTSKPNAV